MSILKLSSASVFLSLAFLGGCVGHIAPLRSDRVATISGRETAGLTNDAARRKVLAEAARQTVDHGLRYFVILQGPPQRGTSPSKPALPGSAETAIRAGSDVSFRAFSKGQIAPGAAGVMDAYRILDAPNKAYAPTR